MSTCRRNKESPLQLDSGRLPGEPWFGDRWTFFFFLISIRREYRQGQRRRQILLPILPSPGHNVSSGVSVPVPLGQGNLCLGFAQTICWSLLESFVPRLALAEQQSIWAAFSAPKKTVWSRVILCVEKG